MEIKRDVIKAYALKNAVSHEGKAVLGSVISGLFNEGLEKGKIKDIMVDVNEVLKEVNSLSLEKQLEEYEKLKDNVGKRPEREGLPELEDAEKGVVMRFSPSPSGPMHIGHIMSGLITSLYVEKYGGKFYFQIEDTNPDNIYVPAYKMLQEEGNWIFGNVTEYIIQSDRIDLYYEFLERLFNLEKAYVCDCDNEEFKKLILKKKACECRNKGKDEQLKKWNKMVTGKYKEGEAVVRFKSDLNDKNPAMRDFPLARINKSKHPRQAKNYKVWPLMNLAVTVDDITMKRTHIIRAKDHRDNALRQKLIYSALGFEKQYPKVYFVGRYNFTDLAISASKNRADIENGKYSGWDDIRLPYLASLRKRGFQKEAFVEMVVQRGLSEVDKVISKKDLFEVLGNFNREIVRDKSKKASFKQTTREKADVMILMPDGRYKYGESDVKAKKDDIIYFTKLGYAKYQGTEDKKQVFWFAHA